MRSQLVILSVGLQSETTAELRRRCSDIGNARIVLKSTPNAAAASDVLDAADVDCVVSAYRLSDETGIEFLRSVRDARPDVPFVLYTDAGDESIASEAIAAGVTGYVPAGGNALTGLCDSVFDAVEEYRDELERRRIERRYQAIFDDPNLLVGILDPDGTLLEANQTAAAYVDRDVETMVGKPFSKTAWWDETTREHIRQKIERAAEKNYVEYSADLTDDAGDSYSVTGSIRPVTGKTGRVVSLVVTALDVTERKVQRRRLREERGFLQSVLDALPDVFYAFETSGYLLRWNERLESVTGYSEDEIEEMQVTEFVPDGEIGAIADQFQTVVSDHRTVTVESAFETKDGESLPYEFTGGPLKTPEGEIQGLVGVGRDISERKRRQRRLEAVFNNTYQFTGLVGPDGTVLEANQTALSFGDLDREDVVGTKTWDTYWFQESEATRKAVTEAVEQARNGDPFRKQIDIQGGERDATIDFSVRPVTDDDGEVTLLVPEGRDITRLNERKRQLQVTNRVLRHNIRNQLNLIRGTAESLPENGTTSNKTAPIVDAADDLLEKAEMTRQLNELVEDIPEPRPVDLLEHAESAAVSVRKNHRGAEIDLATPETASVEAVVEVGAAIEELLENAVVHNADECPRAVVSIAVNGSTVEVAVTDHAGGLPDIERKILTGDANVGPLDHGQELGLWYVYRTVRYSGGSITVHDRPDGSEVRLSLPRSC